MPGRRRFLKAVGLGAAAVTVAAAIPLASAAGDGLRPETAPFRDEEDRRAWRERRKHLTRGFVPEYSDQFP